MANHPTNSEPDNEQRYMALLALTSQALPPQPGREVNRERADLNSLSSEEWESLYRRLDADPKALEEFLRREKPKVATSPANQTAPANEMQSIDRAQANRPIGEWVSHGISACIAWLWGPRVRYIAAFSLTAIIVSLAMVQRLPHAPLLTTVEQSFADVIFQPMSGSPDTLVLPWEHPTGTLSFASVASNPSASEQAFANGLLLGKQRLLQPTAAAASGDENFARYTALGEWNVLLWAVCQSDQFPAGNFWLRQHSIALELAAVEYGMEDAAAIERHLAIAIDTLDALARNENTKRNARRLADELLRFREEFAPHDAAIVRSAR